MMNDCFEIERIIWTEGPDAAPESHLTDCSACREESRRAADLNAALAGMRYRVAVAPETLEPALMSALGRKRLDRARDIVQHPKFWRGAAVGAAAAAAAATAAIGIIAARRRSAAPDLVA